MPPKTFITPRANTRSRGYLPHWELENAAYHIIFRLADSLPRHVAEELARERQALGAVNYELRFDDALDRGHGLGTLKRPEIAEIVAGALRYFDGKRYDLLAWCVMPNHVHVLAHMHDSLESVLHSWKSYTAHRAIDILGDRNRFWAREYYDHIVRDEEELRRTADYILGNPDKAGLPDWPWRGSRG